MNKVIGSNFAPVAFAAITALFFAVPSHAEIHSKTRELIVVQPKDLPEQAQMPANSFFLYSDDAGSTYLYVEQQQGARLSVFDVTDPSKIRVVASTAIAGPGPFDSQVLVFL